ncbi:Regulator of RpoS [compost metagenome]
MPNKVLVVEDEQILAQNLRDYLEVKRLDVRLAYDGASAIELAEEFAPDVVVLDFRLPDMEGFQVLDAIRQRRDCHFVLTTAHPTSKVRDGAEQRGIRHILFKPFPLAELAQTLRTLLAASGEAEARQATNGFVERRRSQAVSFPLQMYDGTWVVADRRQVQSRATDGEDSPAPAQADPSQ